MPDDFKTPPREQGFSNQQKPQTIQRQAQTLSQQNLQSPNTPRPNVGPDLTKKFEGFSPETYTETFGQQPIPTIGYGFNRNVHKDLPDQMTREQADQYFDPLYSQAQEIAQGFAGEQTYSSLNPDRQIVLNDMAYNLGNRLNQFQRMRDAIRAGDFDMAAQEMERSLWYKQVKDRGKDLVYFWNNAFDPDGPKYDYLTARAKGIRPDSTGHWPSLDPDTGMVLKGMGHKSFDKTLAAEAELGNKIVFKDGRYWSVKGSQKDQEVPEFEQNDHLQALWSKGWNDG